MFGKLAFVIPPPSLLFGWIAYSSIEDSTLFFLSVVEFSLGIYLLYRSIYITLYSEVTQATILKRKRKKSEHPGQTSRLFKYTFLIHNTHYTLPQTISMGGFKEYANGESLVVYITDHKKHFAIPKQLLLYYYFTALFFLVNAMLLLQI